VANSDGTLDPWGCIFERFDAGVFHCRAITSLNRGDLYPASVTIIGRQCEGIMACEVFKIPYVLQLSLCACCSELASNLRMTA
jgi:hypothetical protein